MRVYLGSPGTNINNFSSKHVKQQFVISDGSNNEIYQGCNPSLYAVTLLIIHLELCFVAYDIIKG